MEGLEEDFVFLANTVDTVEGDRAVWDLKSPRLHPSSPSSEPADKLSDVCRSYLTPVTSSHFLFLTSPLIRLLVFSLQK